MEILKWLVIAAASCVGGYFGHTMTGNWGGAAIAMASSGIVLAMLINGHWLGALVTGILGLYLVFQAMGEGRDHAQPQVAPAQATAVAGTGTADHARLTL